MEKVDLKENTLNKIYALPEQSGALFELKRDKTNLEEQIELKYLSKKQISPDSYIFRYQIPNEKLTFGCNLGHYVFFDAIVPTKSNPNGEALSRKYTPINWIEDKGFVDFVIKVYPITEKFTEGGKFTLYLNTMKEGESIKMRGPLGRLQYFGNGKCQFTDIKTLAKIEKTYKKIGFLAGGTGIAPIFQILQAADRNSDSCEFTLFFGNSTEKDILLREDLERFAKNKNFTFKLVFIINNQEEGWKGETGHFNYENISKHMYPPSEDTLIAYCGRKPLCLEVYERSLLQMGHSKDNLFKF